jgi:hypothetical protein
MSFMLNELGAMGMSRESKWIDTV